MPEQIKAPQPTASFEYELFEGDPDHLRTVVATPTQVVPWIDAAELKLKHRIGRGTFGDFWLATHHQSGADFEEYHEVAVKMLHPFDDEFIQKFKNKFERLFLKLREIPGVCWLHGLSVINNQLCIAMKFYEGSIADRMAWLKGGRLQLSDVLRYGINLANAILELHSIGMLVLNLKASNFLLNEHDQAVLGDFGIPYLLLGIPLLNSNMTLRIGTPNYMAPEQWEPEIRGPIAVETDSWGFGCSIVEMLTGVPPWFGKSIEEIYQSVVGKKEKPQIPSGLPPAVESVLIGCFEYDLRNRPIMEDIVYVFESSQKAVYSDEGRIGLESRAITEKVSFDGYTSWYLSKDHLQVGDTVRSRKPLNAQRLQRMDVPRGTVVGLDGDSDRTGFVLVKVNGIQNPLRVHESKLERVTKGFTVGDWVCLKEECSKHSSIGIVHSIHRDGGVAVAFMGLETLWQGNYSQLQMAKPYYIGQFVRLKSDMLSSKFEWPRKRGRGWAVGRITNVLPNGCLVVHFPGRFPLGNESNTFLADPAEVELVTFDSCPGLVKKYQHVEDFHWAVRPLTIALGLFTTVKISIALGQTVSTKLRRKDQKSGDGKDSQAVSATWLPPPVANILFKDVVPTATIR